VRLLITGATGMLGGTLVHNWGEKFQVFSTGRKSYSAFPKSLFMPFNLLNESYDSLIDWAKPDVIIHCAAITDVDYCEKNIEEAISVNAESVKKFLKYGSQSKLIFISSDAVFPDGVHMATEKDQTFPENVYGKTKELAEKYIKDSGGDHIAIRTTIVGKNINPNYQSFIEWIINSVKKGKSITLFKDALFTPITTWDLANEIEWLIKSDVRGIIHIAGHQPISKYDFGKEICEKLNLKTNLIKSGNLENTEFIAKRSKDQTLSSVFFCSEYNRTLPKSNEMMDTIIKQFQEFNYE
tara:strand:+ start:814 stop:1701 length:888 start_codon:yes stop_codon:yes gene_type:complete